MTSLILASRRPEHVRGVRRVRRAFVTAAMLVALVGTGCTERESPEAKIRKVLDAGVTALEARDVDAAAATLAEGYKDDGGRTKTQLKRLAFFALQQGPVLVALQSVDVTVEKGAATAKLKVLAVQGSAQLKSARDLLPTNARAFDLVVRLVDKDDDWLVTAIDGLGSSSFP